MFVLDNEVVRAGWGAAKSHTLDLIAKHGGTVHTARHWGERKLAYSIKGRSRATYLLAYYELPSEGYPTFVRDLDLSETVLRYLFTKITAVPEGEAAEAAKETEADFTVPEPPRDEVGEYKLWEDKEEDAPVRPRREREAPATEEKAEPVAAGVETTPATGAEGAATEGAKSTEEK
jgi:ribosomal protein S6